MEYFYVSRVIGSYSSIDMTDRNAYELMMNLLNDYLLVWRNVTFILVDDVKSNTQSVLSIMFIFIYIYGDFVNIRKRYDFCGVVQRYCSRKNSGQPIPFGRAVRYVFYS